MGTASMMCSGCRTCDLGENADLNLVIKKGKNIKRALKSEIKDIIHSPLRSVGIIPSQWALD